MLGRPSHGLLALALLASGACASAAEPSAPATTVARPATRGADASPAADKLDATLWVQTSAEYTAATLQAYRLAELMLAGALADRDWSAALEQRDRAGFADLPPAVILDIDETVLDNSPYQARLIVAGAEYTTASWEDWVGEAKAAPVAGALEFTSAAVAAGVTVFYVTNRRHQVEAATRANLERYGFPLSGDRDTVLSRDEREGWGDDKGSRRRAVAEEFRILLLVGDDYGDFASRVDLPVVDRERLVQLHRELWGTAWIMLPNPRYGSWEAALYDHESGLTTEERRRRRLAALDLAH